MAFEEDRTPYSAPRSLSEDARLEELPAEDRDIRAFAHENEHGYYVGRFRAFEKNGATKFNKAALIFGSNWMFFRKLYRWAVPVSVGEFLVVTLWGFASGALAGAALGNQALSLALSLGSFAVLFLARIPLAIYANRLYFAKLREKTEESHRLHDDEAERLVWLGRQGGTRLFFVFVNTAAGFLVSLVWQAVVG